MLRDGSDRTRDRTTSAVVSRSDQNGRRGADLVTTLQKQAGNAAMTLMLQRKPTGTKHKSVGSNAATKAMRDEGTGLAMVVSYVVADKAPPMDADELAALTDPMQTFVRNTYSAIHDRPYGQPKGDRLTGTTREAAYYTATVLLPVASMYLSLDPQGKRVLPKLRSALGGAAKPATHDAVLERAHRDAELAAQLRSRKAMAARAEAAIGLAKLHEVYSKVDSLAEGLVGAAGHDTASKLLGEVQGGIKTAKAVIKATDPEEYRKLLGEARKFTGEHGTVRGVAKAVEVETEIIDMTIGTATKVGKTLASASNFLLGSSLPLKELKALEEAGELIAKSGRIGLKLGTVLEKIEKFETVLAVVSIAGNVGKLINAESKQDKADATVGLGTAVMTVGGKVAGRAALGTAASAVMLTWEMVKFFGGLGADAIEGSMYGGLYAELKEIDARGDAMAAALAPFSRALEERDRRFGANSFGPAAAGADEAVDDLQHRLGVQMQLLDKRWRNSSIEALAKAYPADVHNSAVWSMQEGYPASVVEQSAVDQLTALTGAYASAQRIVIQMLVNDGYMSRAHADRQLKTLTESGASKG